MVSRRCCSAGFVEQGTRRRRSCSGARRRAALSDPCVSEVRAALHAALHVLPWRVGARMAGHGSVGPRSKIRQRLSHPTSTICSPAPEGTELAFKDDCTAAVREIITTDFNVRFARVVPTTDTVAQKDGAVYLDAAYVYADMADSTGMAHLFAAQDAAKIIRAYLNAVSRVLRNRGGEIRSFDGDRVMALFTGDDAADKAVDAALRINWVVTNIVHDQLVAHHEAYRDKWIEDDWRVRHRTGIDLGTALIVRAGVRGNSDLVSIGDAPNIAAKLSDYKGGGPTIITEDVWDKLKYSNCYSSKHGGESMWTAPDWEDVGGSTQEIRTSTWWRPYS